MSMDFLSAKQEIVNAINLSGTTVNGKLMGSEGITKVGDNGFVDWKFMKENQRIKLNMRIGSKVLYRVDNYNPNKTLHEDTLSIKHQPITVESLEQLVESALFQANELLKNRTKK